MKVFYGSRASMPFSGMTLIFAMSGRQSGIADRFIVKRCNLDPAVHQSLGEYVRQAVIRRSSIAILCFQLFQFLVTKIGVPLAGVVDPRSFFEVARLGATPLQLLQTLAHAVQRGNL